MKTTKTNLIPLPHMGSFIKKKIEEQNISYAEIARRMGVKPPTINNYLEQDTLQTRTLWKLSQALNYNLFTDLISHLPEALQNTNKTVFQETITAQQQEITNLKKEIALYKEILIK